MAARLDRIAVVVDDLDGAMHQLEEVFDMTFVVLEVDSMGIRVAISESGLELVEKTAQGEIAIEQVWRGPIASLEIRVDDIDAAVTTLNESGHPVHHSLTTPGGVPKVQMGALHGAPTLLYHVPRGVSYVEAVTGRTTGDRYTGYSPSVDWDPDS